jgi:hypothetical protein
MNWLTDVDNQIFVATERYLLVDLCRLISTYVESRLFIIGGEYRDTNTKDTNTKDTNTKDTKTRELAHTQVWDGYNLESFAKNQRSLQWPCIFIDPNGRLCAGGRNNAHTERYNCMSKKWEDYPLVRSPMSSISRPPRASSGERYRVYKFPAIGAIHTDAVSYDATRDGFWILNDETTVSFYDIQSNKLNKSFPRFESRSDIGPWSQFAIVHGQVYVLGGDTRGRSEMAYLLSNAADDDCNMHCNMHWTRLTIPLRFKNFKNPDTNPDTHVGNVENVDIHQTCFIVAVFGDEILLIGGIFNIMNADKTLQASLQESLHERAITSWNPSLNERKLVTVLPRPRTYFSAIVI